MTDLALKSTTEIVEMVPNFSAVLFPWKDAGLRR
jgi:hypothetical protein